MKVLGRSLSLSKIGACLYALILFGLNFIRIFDNNFWGDEAFSTLMVMNSLPEIIVKTAADVHPPLYYLFLKIGYEIFGNQGWVFHLVSLIPCAIILIFALTSVWKRMGKEASFILMTLAALSSNAVHFNMEVRMYSWGGLFVLLSFYFLHRILEEETNRNYCWFAVFSLAAAYTHYYCVVSVAFFYLVLMFLAFFRRTLSVKRVSLTVIGTVLGYLPWFFTMLRSLLKRTGSYWITKIPTFDQSMLYLFSESNKFLLYILIVLASLVFAGIGASSLEKENSSLPCHSRTRNSADVIWIFSGFLSILGTTGFGILLSEAIRPFYGLRYIYPVSVLAWLMLGRCVALLKYKRLVTCLLLLEMVVVFLPAYKRTYKAEKASNDKLQTTLSATINNISKNDIILASHAHMGWTIARYYYPNVKVRTVKLEKLPKLEQGKRYWLIITNSQKKDVMDKVYQQIGNQGFAWRNVVNDGCLGTHKVYIYRLDSRPTIEDKQTARLDIKLNGENVKFDLVEKSDDSAKANVPGWFQKGGKGYQIETADGKIKLVFKTDSDGKLDIWLRGRDIRTPGDNKKRIPVWIDYTSFKFNGKEELAERTAVWHDKPKKLTYQVKAGDTITIESAWQQHASKERD